MDKKSLINGLLVVAFGVIAFILVYQWRSTSNGYREMINQKDLSLRNMNVLVNDLAIIQQYNQILSRDTLANLDVINVRGEAFRIHDLLLDESLIFFFQNDMCSACVEKEFKNLRQALMSYERSKVFVLMKGYNSKYMSLSEDLEDIRDRIFSIKEMPYESGNLSHTPSIALVHKNGAVSTAYHAIKGMNLNFELFLEVINGTYAKVGSM